MSATSGPDAPLPAALALTPLARGAWTAVVADGELLLSTVTTPAWHDGAARAERTRDGAYTMTRPVAEDALPAWVRALVGRRVTAVAADGTRCEVTIGALRLRSRFEHHSGEVELGLTPPPRLRAGAVVDEEMWERGERTLTASLGGRLCADAIYAFAGEADGPLLPTRRAPDAALAERALAAFRALPEWLDLQDLYTTDRQHYSEEESFPVRWDDLYGEQPTIVTYEDADRARRVVVIERDAYEGCGSPGGRLGAAFEVGHDGALTRVYASERVFSPTAIVDVDHDGVLDAIDGSRRPSSFRTIGGALVPLQERMVPDYTAWGCPC